MTEEDIKYRQGRSKEQYESSTKGGYDSLYRVYYIRNLFYY